MIRRMPRPPTLARAAARHALALAAAATLLAGAGAARAGGPRVVPPSCDHLQLVLDPRLTPETLERDWRSGAPHEEANAALELRGCRDEVLDRLELAAPLARIDPDPLHGTRVPTWLVSADLTAEMGSFNGPLTLPVEVVGHRLRVARARGPAGASAPIQLADTGHASWRRSATKHGDELLAISAGAGTPDTTWQRFHLTPGGWRWSERYTPGRWDAEADFPAASRFPPP